jgi:hypothetical protein
MRSLIILTLLVIIPMITSKANATDQDTNFTAGIIIGGDKYTNSNSRRYTCNAAKVKIGLEGFDNIRALNCNGNNYQFLSVTKGVKLLIVINSRTGTILNIKPI